MTVCLTLTVGVGEDRHGRTIIPEHRIRAIDYATEKLTGVYGGVTITEGRGSWKNGLGVAVSEPVVIFTVYTNGPASVYSDQFRDIADSLAVVLNQESVLITRSDAEMKFVDTRYSQATPIFGNYFATDGTPCHNIATRDAINERLASA